MATRGEGLVIKHPDASYVLNGRNKDWIKVSLRYDFTERNTCLVSPQVKPEYMVSCRRVFLRVSCSEFE
jgi:hypothetical protein